MFSAAPPFLRRRASRRSCRSERRRRAFVWAATIWFAIVTSGVPLPAGMPAEKLGGLFPCMHHACGCRSAAACWTDCCCYTKEEKLAWARANGVNPPAGTPLFDPETKKAIVDETPPSDERSCCAKKKDSSPALEAPVRACCRAKTDGNSNACCEASSDGTDDDATPAGIAILQAMKCRGVASSWTGTGEPFVAPCAVDWSPEISFSDPLPAEENFFVARRLRYVGPPG